MSVAVGGRRLGLGSVQSLSLSCSWVSESYISDLKWSFLLNFVTGQFVSYV